MNPVFGQQPAVDDQFLDIGVLNRPDEFDLNIDVRQISSSDRDVVFHLSTRSMHRGDRIVVPPDHGQGPRRSASDHRLFRDPHVLVVHSDGERNRLGIEHREIRDADGLHHLVNVSGQLGTVQDCRKQFKRRLHAKCTVLVLRHDDGFIAGAD